MTNGSRPMFHEVESGRQVDKVSSVRVVRKLRSTCCPRHSAPWPRGTDAAGQQQLPLHQGWDARCGPFLRTVLWFDLASDESLVMWTQLKSGRRTMSPLPTARPIVVASNDHGDARWHRRR